MARLKNTAFIFPGQGSQSIGMLADFNEDKRVRDSFEQASDTLGYDLWQLAQSGPEVEINSTDKTQPLLLASSIALWRLWAERAALPSFVAGHSLGEYTALVASGVLDFEDSLRLVEKRGQFMQQAVQDVDGKMAAIIGLSDEKIIEVCDSMANGQIVSPVNFNSPGQTVIAGNAEAVDRAMIGCKDAGAKKAMPLAVSVPCHCLLMKPASESLSAMMDSITFSLPNIPVVNNIDVKVEEETAAIKEALIRQLFGPVRWSESIEFLRDQGVTNLVECGSGKVLSGLNRRIDRSLNSFQTLNQDLFDKTLTALTGEGE